MLQADKLPAGGSGAEPMFQLATGLLADGGFASEQLSLQVPIDSGFICSS